MAKAARLDIDLIAKADKAVGAFETVKKKASDSYGAMKLAAVGAAAAVIAGLSKATEAAAEHQTNVARLEQAYKNAGLATGDMKGSLEEIEAQSRRTGASTEDSIAAYTQLVTATKNTAQAHEMLATAQDLAVYKGISLTDATSDLIRLQAGNTRSARELGIATKDAAGHQLSATEIMKNLTAAVHGQADAFGDTAAGQMARYHESLDQTKEKIGEGLLPALQSVLNILAPLFTWLSNNAAVLRVLAPIAAILAGAVIAISTAMKVATIVQWAWNVAMDANPIGLVVIAIAALVAAVIIAYHNFGAFRDAVNWAWQAIQAGAAWIAAHWKPIVDILLGPLGLVITNFGAIERAIRSVISALGEIGHAVSDAIGWLGKLPSNAGSILGKLNPFSLPPSSPAPAPVFIQIVATPGDDLPQVVYDAMRRYQRQHRRPELRALFG